MKRPERRLTITTAKPREGHGAVDLVERRREAQIERGFSGIQYEGAGRADRARELSRQALDITTEPQTRARLQQLLRALPPSTAEASP